MWLVRNSHRIDGDVSTFLINFNKLMRITLTSLDNCNFSLALKGKGAKIFERQQRRMHQYTKESEGEVTPDMATTPNRKNYNNCTPILRSQDVNKGPDTDTKLDMNKVLGEFKSSSNPDGAVVSFAHDIITK